LGRKGRGHAVLRLGALQAEARARAMADPGRR
jgi:hypothetical protein